MKAVIVGVKRKTAAMLCEDGSIVKVVNKNYSIGKEVDAGMTTKLMTIRTAITVAAASLLFALGLGTSSYYVPARYVSVDINPSIEYSVNMYNRVVDAKGVNEDGEHILQELNIKELKNKKIEDVVSMTVTEAAKEGYLKNEGSGIMIATAARNNNNAEELAAKLKEAVTAVVEASNSNALVMGEAVGLERVEEAKELGITPGKLNLIEKLIESSENPESINKEDWLDKSVKEIMEQTKENKDIGQENRPAGKHQARKIGHLDTRSGKLGHLRHQARRTDRLKLRDKIRYRTVTMVMDEDKTNIQSQNLVCYRQNRFSLFCFFL